MPQPPKGLRSAIWDVAEEIVEEVASRRMTRHEKTLAVYRLVCDYRARVLGDVIAKVREA